MKLAEFRKNTRYKIVKTDYSFKDIMSFYNLNMVIPLKCGINLQRGLVWTDHQKHELIESVVRGKWIPPITGWVNGDQFLVIDGKQRLSTLIEFMDDGFLWRGVLYTELPEEIQRVIWDFNLVVARVTQVSFLTDSEFLEIFESVNFRGTPQDAQHLETLKSHINGR